MERRGRKSTSAKPVAVAVPSVGALSIIPPVVLTESEQAVWDRIVCDEPNGAFTPEHADLLVAYCRHCVQATVLSDLINAVRPTQLRTQKGLNRFEQLLAMREREVRSASSLATRLRITRQATYDPKTVARSKNNSGRGAKPWEDDE